MSLIRDVIFKKYPDVIALLKLEKTKLNLKPVNKLTIRFDPFGDGVSHIRNFSHSIHENNIVRTNPKCIIKTEILTDRSLPHVVFDLIDGKQFIFKCANLKLLEIFQLMNEHITPLAPKEDFIKPPIKKILKKK